jgi:lipoprotein-anchoring transpeptidase ErfK/SrfK
MHCKSSWCIAFYVQTQVSTILSIQIIFRRLVMNKQMTLFLIALVLSAALAINLHTTTPFNPDSTEAALLYEPSISFERRPAKNRLEINIPSRTLYLIQGNLVIKEYPVGLGRSKEFMTPIGEFNVEVKDPKPGWTNPYNGKQIPPGKNNPLGTRWIGFLEKPNGMVYGIHGTNKLDSIGAFSSSRL